MHMGSQRKSFLRRSQSAHPVQPEKGDIFARSLVLGALHSNLEPDQLAHGGSIARGLEELTPSQARVSASCIPDTGFSTHAHIERRRSHACLR